MSIDTYLVFEKERKCPLCKGINKTILSKKMQFGFKCKTVICHNCGFCFVSPPPTKKAYGAFYREAYSKYYHKIHPVPCSDQSLKENTKEKTKLDMIEKHTIFSQAKILEIGPGQGRFLSLAKQRGAEVFAIEPSSEFRANIKRFNVKIIGDFLENTETTVKFDVIMLFQVLEHFHDPVDAVKRILELLKPNGIVILDVPNIWKPFRSLDFYFLRYVHLSYFSPQTLRRLFLSNGYTMTHVDDGGTGIFSPNQLLAIFKPGTVSSETAEFCKDNFRDLYAHLISYRHTYPFFLAPRVITVLFFMDLRRWIAKSYIGDFYRFVKAKKRSFHRK